MNVTEAAKVLGLTAGATAKDIKTAYRKACSKFHPDRNPAGLEMMKVINEAYSVLECLESIENIETPTGNPDDYADFLNAALSVACTLSGVVVEVCGTWVWVTGETKQHREALKNAGFFWASKKLAWYYRPADYKSTGRGSYSLDDIRSAYGTSQVNGTGRKSLQGAA